jgi:hypothetical protein
MTKENMWIQALGSAAMAAAGANQPGQSFGNVLGAAGGGLAQGMGQARKDYRAGELDRFKLDKAKREEELAKVTAAQTASTRKMGLEAAQSLPDNDPMKKWAIHNPVQYGETLMKEGLEAQFAGLEGADPILKNRGVAYDAYKELHFREGPLSQQDQADYDATLSFLNQPYTVTTPTGTQTYQGLGLPGRGGGGAAATGGVGAPSAAGVPSADGGDTGGGSRPDWSPAKVGSEQTGRVAFADAIATMGHLDMLEQIVDRPGYTTAYIGDALGLPAWLQSEMGRDLTVAKSQTNELVLRIMTGAAAPDAEVERMGRWLDFPPGASKAETKRRTAVIRTFLANYQRLADPGGNLTPQQWDAIVPEYTDAPAEAAAPASGGEDPLDAIFNAL